MDPKIKNILWSVFAVVFVVVFVVWMFLNPGPEHMEDTNGADDYTLQTITEQDVIEHKMGTKGTLSESETQYNLAGLGISSGRKYSAKKFTGVHMLYNATIMKGSDIYVNLAEFEVREGNFAFYIIFDDEIVGQVEPNESGISEFLLENVEKSGSLVYVIAGESANFQFIVPAGWN